MTYPPAGWPGRGFSDDMCGREQARLYGEAAETFGQDTAYGMYREAQRGAINPMEAAQNAAGAAAHHRDTVAWAQRAAAAGAATPPSVASPQVEPGSEPTPQLAPPVTRSSWPFSQPLSEPGPPSKTPRIIMGVVGFLGAVTVLFYPVVGGPYGSPGFMTIVWLAFVALFAWAVIDG